MSEEEKLQEEPNQEEKELFKIRKTYVRLFWPLALAALYVAIPLLLVQILLQYSFSRIIFFVWLGLVLLFLAKEIIKWFFDLYIFTDQRIIIAQKSNFFKRELAEIYYAEVGGIKTEIQGMIATLFHFGNIEIELKEGGKIVLEDIAHPEEIQSFLQEKKVKINKF